MKNETVTVDVREDIRSGREPFSRIMQAVMNLGDGQKLRLIAPFEPAPLYAVLGNQGFSHRSRPLEGDDWEVLFERPAIGGSETMSPANRAVEQPGPAPVVEVDARGLEPPQPLVTILEAVAQLPEGQELRAHTDRRPMHLYSQLEERGFIGESEEQEDGGFITTIRRA